MQYKRPFRSFLTLASMFALLSFGGQLTPAHAGCGCDKPPPPPAAVRPNATYAGMPVTLFHSSLIAGQSYTVEFTAMTGQSLSVPAVAVNRRDLADGVYKNQLVVPVPPLPLGPASLTVTVPKQSAPFLSIPDTAFTVAPPPVVVPDQVGSFSYQNFQAAVGRDGRVYLSLDVTGTTMPRTFKAQAKGWPLRFTKDSTVFYNTQGFLMQLASAPIPGLFSIDSGTATDSDIAQYARHEFNTYFLQHAEHLPHSVDPTDGNWHLDGSRHVDHNHLILTLAGVVNGSVPAPGATPAFTLALNTYSFFQYGVVGTDAISMSGATSTDSYNFKTSLPDLQGDVFTNGTLSMGNTATVNGDATAAAFNLNGSALVNGTMISATQPKTFIPVAIPKGLTNLGSISIGAGATQTLSRDSYLVNDLSVQNGGQLVVDNTTGPVTLYVTGQVKLSGGAILPVDPNPEKFAVYVASSQNVAIASDGSFYGVIYAPQSTVSLTGQGTFSGSFIGQQMKLTSSAVVHYDTALRGQ